MLLSLCACALAALHNGPPVFLGFEVLEGEVRLEITGEQQALGEWLGVGATAPPLTDEARRAELMEAGRALWTELAPIEIDGERVAPVVTGVRVFDSVAQVFGKEDGYVYQLSYPCTGKPRAITVTWSRFPPDPRGGLPKMPLYVQADGDFQMHYLLEDEPSYTWHAPRPGSGRLAPAPLDTPPARRALWCAAAGAALLVGGALALRSRRPARRAAAALGGLVLGGALWAAAPAAVRVPRGDAAFELFATLHARLYGAFASTNEHEIYAQLASCVDDAILDALYQDIYHSLILREEGAGAVCQVTAVQPLAREAAEPDPVGSRPAFGVEWTWRVEGRVIHYGHEHERQSRYRARYTVAHDGRGWKIAGVEPLAMEREAPDDGE